MENLLYWSVYIIAAATAGYHSFVVYSLSDPWPIALGGALSIDGLTTYAVYAIKNWKGNQRLAGFIGVAVFAFVSGMAQVIARYHGLGIPLPAWLNWISMGLVPLSTVGAVIILGVINAFRNHGAAEVSPLESLQNTVRTLADKVEQSVSRPSPVSSNELDDFTRAELPKLTTEFAADVPQLEVKRKRGRPPKAIGG